MVDAEDARFNDEHQIRTAQSTDADSYLFVSCVSGIWAVGWVGGVTLRRSGERRSELSQLALNQAHIFRTHAEKVPLGAGQRLELVVGPGVGHDQLLDLCGLFQHGHRQ